MRTSLLLLVTSSVLLIAPAIAINPLDNDAGSGGDAGDIPLTAVSILSGTYEGRLTPSMDTVDLYRFVGNAGQQVRMQLPTPGVFLELRAAGDTPVLDGASYGFVFGGFAGGEATYLLPFDGPWYLRFSLSNVLPTSYAFTFEVSDPAAVILSSSDAEWQTIEIRYSGNTSVQAFARAVFPGKPGPASFMKTVDLVLDDGGMGASASHLSGNGVGTNLRVNDATVPSLVPAVQTNVTDGYGWSSTTFNLVGSGTVRLSVYTTTGSGTLAYVRLGSASVVEQAQAEGNGTVRWDEMNADADPAIVLPGASVVGPRSLDLDVNDRFIGFFGAHDAEATVTDPDGNDVPLVDICDCTFFVNPILGSWRFSLGPTTHVLTSEHDYLDGAFVPRLGVAGDAWSRP